MYLIIVRGLPGSGKSTLAKELAAQYGLAHFETDMYFIDSTGEYRYDAAKLGDAIVWSETQVDQALGAGRNVVVTGVFSRLCHMHNLRKIAATHHASILVITAEGAYGSIHNVPEQVIAGMKERWEPMPKGWLESPLVS